jgi:hypothetical protein
MTLQKGWADAQLPKVQMQYDSTEWGTRLPVGWVGQYSDNAFGMRYVRKNGSICVYPTKLMAEQAAKYARLHDLSMIPPKRQERVVTIEQGKRAWKKLLLKTANSAG